MDDDREAFFRRASNWHGGEPESWEKTHDEYGNYIGSGRSGNVPPPFNAQPASPQPNAEPPCQQTYGGNATSVEREINSKVNFNGYTAPPKAEKEKAQPMDLSDMGKYIPPDVYDNFIIYRPQNSADVEKLIDYLRSRKPAIVDLDPICDSPDAQRVLDFTSGAVYALGGKIAAIKPNLFLIVSVKRKISISD